MTPFADALTRSHQRGDSPVRLAAALAEFLPGWRHDPTESSRSILYGPDRGRLLIEFLITGSVRRARIIPKLPDGTPCQLLEEARGKSITVALDRGPAVIAREITRRLLPDFEADLKAAAELRSSREPDREHQDARIRAVLALVPESSERDRHPANTTRSISLPGPGTATVGIAFDGTEMLSFSGISATLLDQLLETYNRTITGGES